MCIFGALHCTCDSSHVQYEGLVSLIHIFGIIFEYINIVGRFVTDSEGEAGGGVKKVECGRCVRGL